ncbi:four-carbon acid sugar kinase family protein [Paenibacillus rhizovicinus]|uniref:Four-carbon acid sugar kinase family protein n=1 Tax=Paenibacillus rhizovicinus TaxID=2704463 RepID=A0A6C0P5P2_9BACL|nr:four-carbon acid sugar kinase family protein [Paenibacillus rhizovicinus]QHW33671.1 four-carbon acid sugar kinase family protein [Paenibacillus rhizovicinus]
MSVVSNAPSLIGIVADDVTGANDIGIMYAKAGYKTHVYTYDPAEPLHMQSGERPDVIVLDTDSRFDAPETAYGKVFEATRELQRAGCTAFINKTCSVGRGNIGAEFDAMLDALNERFAAVVFGFPKNGRLTQGGIHYVHGRKLEDSEFRHDPVHPMTRSDLAGILRRQTNRKVTIVTGETVAQGAKAVSARIEELKKDYGYAIIDVEDQASLHTIAEAVQDERVTAGASALSEELALVWGAKQGAGDESGVPKRDELGVVIAAGSLMPQTAGQIAEVKAAGRVAAYELNALLLFTEEERESELGRIAASMAAAVSAGRDALVHSPNTPEAVARTIAEGERRGLAGTEVSRLVSGAVAAIVQRVLAATGQNRAVIAGGDTSAAVCAGLGVRGMRIFREIQPGLPSCVTLGERPLLLVLKSGSFGKPDFLLQAADHVRHA